MGAVLRVRVLPKGGHSNRSEPQLRKGDHLDERAYDDGLREAMKKLVDEYSFVYPGIRSVEHVYFYAVHGADDATRRGYLERAYALGRDFAPAESASATAAHA